MIKIILVFSLCIFRLLFSAQHNLTFYLSDATYQQKTNALIKLIRNPNEQQESVKIIYGIATSAKNKKGLNDEFDLLTANKANTLISPLMAAIQANNTHTATALIHVINQNATYQEHLERSGIYTDGKKWYISTKQNKNYDRYYLACALQKQSFLIVNTLIQALTFQKNLHYPLTMLRPENISHLNEISIMALNKCIAEPIQEKVAQYCNMLTLSNIRSMSAQKLWVLNQNHHYSFSIKQRLLIGLRLLLHNNKPYKSDTKTI